jgi:hypothetical protein
MKLFKKHLPMNTNVKKKENDPKNSLGLNSIRGKGLNNYFLTKENHGAFQNNVPNNTNF